MATQITYRNIWKIAYPVILGGVVENVVLATDTIFLGRLGEIALGAAALGGLFYFIAVFVANGVGVGVQIILSRRYGEKNFHQIGGLLAQAGLLLFLISCFLFVGLFFFSDAFFSLTIASREVLKVTTHFLQYRSFGVFFATYNALMSAFFISIHRTKVISLSAVLTGLVNILLDYGLIFGHFGLPEMGVEGAALASVIAEGTASLFLFVYTWSTVPGGRFNLHVTWRPQREKIRRIMTVAAPVMAQNFLSMAGWFIFFLFVEHLGPASLAVSNIVRSLYMIILIPGLGFASASATLVSFLIGEKRQEEVLSLLKKIVLMNLPATVALFLPAMLFSHQILHLYTPDESLVALAKVPLFLVCSASPFLASAFILFQGVSGTGNTLVSLMIETVVLALYLFVAWLLVFPFRFNLSQVWGVEYLYALSLLGVSLAYLLSNRWKGREV